MEISGRSCAVTAKNCTVLKSVMLVQNYCFACVFVQGDKGVFRDVRWDPNSISVMRDRAQISHEA